MTEIFIWKGISLFLLFVIIVFIIFKIFTNKRDEWEEYENYIPGLTNLFTEVKHIWMKGIGYRYIGYIKTLFPNAKEMVVWKSEPHQSESLTKREMNIRFKFLCKFYGLNENGEASDFRMNFNRNFNTDKK